MGETEKTNAMRILEASGIGYTPHSYPHGGEAVDGVTVARLTGRDPAQVAYALAEDYGVLTRVGLHCAPSAHRTLGTYPTGTIRFSFGWWNTADEVDAALRALERLLEGRGGHGA